MDLGIKGKIALVGGSSQGLGRAIAHELAAEGAAVVLCARREAALAEVRDAIARSTGAEVSAVVADLARGDEVHRVAEEALRRHGRVDILVANAGGPPPGPFEAHDAAAWLAAFNLTLMSTV